MTAEFHVKHAGLFSGHPFAVDRPVIVSICVKEDAADYVFGGMDGLLSKNWGFREYIDRSVYIHPEEVLCNPVSMDYLFERYRLGKNSIDYLPVGA